MQVEGTAALVTGANRGLGRAIAEALLDAGAAKVYAGVRDPESVSDDRLIPIALDVTDEAQVRAAAAAAPDVGIVVNNAGTAALGTPLDGDSLDSVRQVLEVNYFGPLSVSRAFAPVLAANGGGALVNVLSVVSWIAIPNLSAYSASKSAVWSLTNSLRATLADQGTLVVGVHAGWIDTDLAATIEEPKTAPEDVAAQIVAAIAAGDEEVLADQFTRDVKAGLSAA